MYQLPPPKYSNEETSFVSISNTDNLVASTMLNIQNVIQKKYQDIDVCKNSELNTVNFWYTQQLEKLNRERDKKLNTITSKYTLLIEHTNNKFVTKLLNSIKNIPNNYTNSWISRVYTFVTSLWS